MPVGSAILLLDAGVGGCGFHAPEFQRRTGILIVIRDQRRDADGLRGEFDGRAGPNRAIGLRNGGAVARDQPVARAVVGSCAIHIKLHELAARDLPAPNGPVNVSNGRFLKVKTESSGRRLRGTLLLRGTRLLRVNLLG